MTVHPSAEIHPSAIVEAGAKIGARVRVGPFSLIGADVSLGEGVDVRSHCVVTGWTEVGDETVIYPFSCIGEIPQDLKFSGEKTRLVVGRRNRIREHVTMNTGTDGGGGVTRIGDDGLFMAGCHIAHDAQVGDRVIVVNQTAVAGHCVIEDDVIIGGLCGIHQWVRIGRGAIIGALSMVTNDVIPYGLVQAARGELEGLNLVGLKRRGVEREDIQAVRKAFQVLGGDDGTFVDRAKSIAENADSEYVQHMVAFILGESDRSFLTPR